MEALLREAGDGLALGTDSNGPAQCRSVDELKARIAQLFVGKISETRAEHVSASFDIPADVVLNLGEAIAQGGGSGSTSENVADGGGTDAEVTMVQGGAVIGGVARSFVTIREAVMSQPEANPLLQHALAAFLILHVRQADGSKWAMQSATRATQGWTITYACQNSVACWHRAHKRRHVVGLSMIEDMQDLNSLGRFSFFGGGGKIHVALQRTPSPANF